MTESAAVLAMLMIALAMVLSAWRALRGPDAADRVLGADTLYINTVALLIAYGVYLGSTHFYEAALLIALLGFVSTVALCRYLLRGNIIE